MSVDGGKGDDTMYGGSDEGRDIMIGEDGDDTMYGGPNPTDSSDDNRKDILYGEAGSDEIHGGRGEDELIPSAGADTVYGGSRRDVIRSKADGEVDYLNCGDHPHDKVEYEAGVDVVNADCENRVPV